MTNKETKILKILHNLINIMERNKQQHKSDLIIRAIIKQIITILEE